MGELFIWMIFLIPIYGLLIYTYLNPEETALWGQRWKFEEEPELTEEAIELTKKTSLIAIIFTTVFTIWFIYDTFAG